KATHSTTATNIRLATSLPRYRLVRLMGDTSSPSKASFSSPSWNARFRARIAAKLNVTHRMLGARSIVATAVGSRPKLNTVSTSAVNTTADSTAVRVRNSRSRSLRAIVQAWRRVSPTSRPPHSPGSPGSPRPNGTPVPFRDLGPLVPPAWREVHATGARPPPFGGDVVQRRPKQQVLHHREVPVEVTLVPDPADGTAPPGHGGASRLRPDQTREHLQERRLPRPIGTEDDERSTGREAEGDVIQRHHVAKGVPEPVSSEHRAVLGMPPWWGNIVRKRRGKKTSFTRLFSCVRASSWRSNQSMPAPTRPTAAARETNEPQRLLR